MESPTDISKLSYAEIQECLNSTALETLPALNFRVLRNEVVEPIEPYWAYLALQMGFHANVQWGNFDNVIQESLTGQDAASGRSPMDCVLVFVGLLSLSPRLLHGFAGMSQKEVQDEIIRITHYISSVMAGIRQQTQTIILWHGFELPVFPSLGIADTCSGEGQLAVIRHLNDAAREQIAKHKGAYFIDLNLCQSRLGARQYWDYRYWHIGRAPYSRAALCEIAMEDFKFIRAVNGKNKKCLVLDCDNTLWGGVVGEEGLAGIKLGKGYPGSPYYEFQQAILDLYHRGIILALCSKNNADDVWDVFDKHPDMVLRREQVAAAQINWEDKITNLKRLSSDLGIGLDSMVFVDDNEFEINLVRTMLPSVTTIWLPPTKSFEYGTLLSSSGLFDTVAITDEDRARGAMYQATMSREKLKSAASDLESYYRSLEMRVEVRRLDAFAVPRVAQLTQKTNQFNLTTKRYSEAEITAYLNNPCVDVLYVRLSDKLGDSGIVGVCILQTHDDRSVIDTFLLSCRVLGRCVEDVLINEAIALAKSRGCREIVGSYIPTKKNEQVKDFYARQGFEREQTASEQGLIQYVFNCSMTTAKETPAFFKEVVSDVGRMKT